MASLYSANYTITVVTRGKGSVKSSTLLKERAIPIGNYELYRSTCTVNV